MKRMLTLTTVCALVALGAGAPLARATVPRAITEHISEVAQWVDRGGITSPAPSCGTTCGTLWSAEHAPSDEDPYGLELWRETERLRERVEVLPRLNSLLREQALTSRTRTVGIRIGSSGGLGRLIWEKVQIPRGTPPTFIARGAEEPEKYVLNYHPAGVSVETVRLLRDEWMIGGRHASGMVLGETFQEGCGAGNGTTGYIPPIGGLFAIVPEYATACAPLFMSYFPVAIYTIPSPVITPSEDYGSQTADSVILDEMELPDWGLRQIEEETTAQLERHADEYGLLIRWLNYSLGGASFDPVDLEAQLSAHEPVYHFESGEDFVPQVVKSFTDNYLVDGEGHYSLERANQLNIGGATLHAASGSPGMGGLPEPLRLEILGETYNDTLRAASGSEDNINARGNDVSTYEADAERLRTEGDGEAVYGRVVTDPNDGKIWLQYWNFYYDNSWTAPLSEVGQHEGDWEMVQVGLSSTGEPDAMTFARHESSETYGCTWEDVEKTGLELEEPIVYPGRGSHASYPHEGATILQEVFRDEHWGGGAVKQPTLHALEAGDAWMTWKGRWGGSTEGSFQSPLTPSQQGEKWSQPSRFQSEHLTPSDCE